MAAIRYKHVYDPMVQGASHKLMYYIDADGNAPWTFPLGTGHRFEREMEEFVAAGGKVEDADIPA